MRRRGEPATRKANRAERAGCAKQLWHPLLGLLYYLPACRLPFICACLPAIHLSCLPCFPCFSLLPACYPPTLLRLSTSHPPAADVFSLGAIAFELLTRRQLLPVGSHLVEYESRVHSLPLMDMAGGW